MLHLPILRWGVPYRSVNQVVTPHFRTREPFVSMSQANLGLIRRDLLRQGEARAAGLQHTRSLSAMRDHVVGGAYPSRAGAADEGSTAVDAGRGARSVRRALRR